MPRLDAAVRSRFNLSWNQARTWIETGKVFVNGQAVRDPAFAVGESDVLDLKMNAPRARESAKTSRTLQASEVVFQDTQIVVVHKPSGISTVPYGREEPFALEQMVCQYLDQRKIGIVQRLDRETSGLLVFARTKEAEKSLANQFRFHTVSRRYFAIAHGDVRSQTIRSALVENRGDGLRGSDRSGRRGAESKMAVTHVAAIAKMPDRTLIECRLETGRTHQIRIHLSEAGHPLLGEKAYIREFQGFLIPAPRLMLHAAELGFEHPTREVRMSWVEPPPPEFMEMLDAPARKALETRLKLAPLSVLGDPIFHRGSKA